MGDGDDGGTADVIPADIVNSVVFIGKGGYVQIDGPFEHEVDGWQWEVTFPTGESQWGSISDVDRQLIEESVENTAIALVGSDVESFGEVESVDVIEEDLVMVARTPGSGQ